ncbi:HVO_2523 family zinc finger protein [Halosimplex marinum]
MSGGGRPRPVCERPTTHRHCTYVRPEHGVVYDCADTLY